MSADAERARLKEQLQVLRAQTGDTEALCQLFRKYNAKLLYYLRRLGGERHDAEDVLQEVWLLVWRKIHTLEDPSAFRSWLYQVARNRANTRFRKSGRVPIPEPLSEATLVETAEPAESELLEQFDARSVHTELSRLTPVHCEVLTLRFLNQLAYAEIATITGSSIGTVRSRIHYAKQSLKRALVESMGKETRE